MLILGLVLLFLAYTIGIIAIVLELVCYQKRIEYLETIFLSFAFVALIFSISISTIAQLFGVTQIASSFSIINLSIIGLSLTTPLNVYAERQVTLPTWLKTLFFAIAGFLVFIVILSGFLKMGKIEDWLVYGFLGLSVLFSMYKLRTTKPKVHIAHQEKIERKMAIAIATILPLCLLLEFYWKTEIPITISIFFIILGTTKIIDNIKRLALFSPSSGRNLIPSNLEGLTPREQEVAEYLVKGASYSKIAEELFISMPTVKTHVSNIYRKVGVKNKMELLYALTN